MKKGCFLVSVSVLTVLIAAVIYIFKFHEDDLIRMLKPMFVGKSQEEVYKKIDHLSVKENSDSLKSVVYTFVKNLDNAHKIDVKDIGNFFEKANKIVDDGRIDSIELTELSNYLKNQN